jgi:hypothetical protein
MVERWGDSQADRDALDRWLTTEPDRGDEEALEEEPDEGDGMEEAMERDTPIGLDDDGGCDEPPDIDSDEGYDPYTGGHELFERDDCDF